MNKTIFVCFRWGTLYPPVSVERLYRSVKRHFSLPFQFHCLTDADLDVSPSIIQHRIELGKPFHGNWNKERIFASDFLGLDPGTFVICLDLDILITGNLDFLVDCHPESPLVMAPSQKKGRSGGGHGSVIRIRKGELPELWDDLFKYDYEALVKELGGEREQSWIDRYFPPGQVMQFPEESIVSFKFQCDAKGSTPLGKTAARWGITDALWKKAKLPDNARVVCFHGKPDLDDVASGRYGHWRHAPFINKHLQES
ncbi:MAG: hypothetical protein MUC65_10185 [Pontiellaceae bacterium]|jgi:hypothetical protein|nr:hypothetical protein [Pontiellaceae bacterium]